MSKKKYIFNESKTGELVPAIILENGNTQSLHSMIDPKNEAQRLISASGNSDFLIFFGLGGGFAPLYALENTNAQVLVIDYDKNDVNELLTGKDYSALLNNNRFCLLVDPSNEQIIKTIHSKFNPALYNGIKTIPLRVRIEQDREKFDNAIRAVQESIDIASGDYSVQAHFGKKWFCNIIRNIKNIDTLEYNGLEYQNLQKKQILNAAIAAAGPSLDSQIPALAELKSQGVYIICTDTALGSLLYNNIEPDIVVSIDCQFISYYHFLTETNYSHYKQNKNNIPLVLDIASPSMLCNIKQFTPVFFSSAHPLALYLNSHWRQFPLFDTSGGNVTHTCLSLAESLGAQNITLFGADFAYIRSQSYARGTYIYPYFHKRQNRLSPAEALFSSFLYRTEFLPHDSTKIKDYYETASLRSYRIKLEEKAAKMNCKIICAKGSGAPVNLHKKNTAKDERIFSPVNTDRTISGIEFLSQYRDDIAALPAGDDGDYLNKLNQKERVIFTTLLPFAAAIKMRNADLTKSSLIEEVKNRSIKEIDQVLG
ncbi:MAG: DUF115 domain-containing protein [Treponema sp.]|nr:DUF115 domain-containing protein [Treponema sp.]